MTADRRKLNLHRDDLAELFDLNSDPGELHNLAGESAHHDRRQRLTSRLLAWQQETGDRLPLGA